VAGALFICAASSRLCSVTCASRTWGSPTPTPWSSGRLPVVAVISVHRIGTLTKRVTRAGVVEGRLQEVSPCSWRDSCGRHLSQRCPRDWWVWGSNHDARIVRTLPAPLRAKMTQACPGGPRSTSRCRRMTSVATTAHLPMARGHDELQECQSPSLGKTRCKPIQCRPAPREAKSFSDLCPLGPWSAVSSVQLTTRESQGVSKRHLQMLHSFAGG
jgi:hypothetical protein